MNLVEEINKKIDENKKLFIDYKKIINLYKNYNIVNIHIDNVGLIHGSFDINDEQIIHLVDDMLIKTMTYRNDSITIGIYCIFKIKNNGLPIFLHSIDKIHICNYLITNNEITFFYDFEKQIPKQLKKFIPDIIEYLNKGPDSLFGKFSFDFSKVEIPKNIKMYMNLL